MEEIIPGEKRNKKKDKKKNNKKFPYKRFGKYRNMILKQKE